MNVGPSLWMAFLDKNSSQLSMSGFFVFRKMETCEITPHMRVRAKMLYKIAFPIYDKGVHAAIKERKNDLYGEGGQ